MCAYIEVEGWSNKQTGKQRMRLCIQLWGVTNAVCGVHYETVWELERSQVSCFFIPLLIKLLFRMVFDEVNLCNLYFTVFLQVMLQ